MWVTVDKSMSKRSPSIKSSFLSISSVSKEPTALDSIADFPCRCSRCCSRSHRSRACLARMAESCRDGESSTPVARFNIPGGSSNTAWPTSFPVPDPRSTKCTPEGEDKDDDESSQSWSPTTVVVVTRYRKSSCHQSGHRQK